MLHHSKVVGLPVSRIDGPLKVTGTAHYATEHAAPGMLYGYVVPATIATGRILAVHTHEAGSFPGVVKVYTHENRPKAAFRDAKAKGAQLGRKVQTGYNADTGQPVYETEELDYEVLPQIVVEVAEFRGEHQRQNPAGLRPAAQSLDTVPAGSIRVGGDVEAHATKWQLEGGEVIGGQCRHHGHGGHDV